MNKREDICDTILSKIGVTRDEKGRPEFTKRELESILAWINIRNERIRTLGDRVDELQLKLKGFLKEGE